MSVNSFVLAFVGIIIGLSVADLLRSLHLLLRAGRRVKWDWLAPTFAAMMLLVTVGFWWWSYDWYDGASSATVAGFLPRFLFLIVAFLMMAAALPDQVPEEGLDLREFYFSSRVQLWTLLSLTLTLSILITYMDSPEGVAAFAARAWPAGLAVVAAIIAACSPRVWVHGLAIAWIFGVTLYHNLFLRIGS